METAESHRVAAEQALGQGRAREALDEARAVLRLDPQSGQAHALMGLAWVLMGEEPEARAAFARAEELAPLDSRVRYLYSVGLDRLRDREGARAQLTYFCQLEPNNAQAAQVLAKLGGPAPDLTPLPRPASSAVWYDGGGHALTDSGELESYAEQAEPPPGPGVITCPECEKRTWKGIVCKHCGARLPAGAS